MMKNRCRYDYFHGNYKQRGITVCERWQSFENFLADMGERPDGTSLDRYPDYNGNYEPGNCRWATQKEQVNNTNRNVYISVNGVTKTQSQWAEITGLREETISARMKRGWSKEAAVTTLPLTWKAKKASNNHEARFTGGGEQ